MKKLLTALVLALLMGTAHAADVSISALPAASTPTGTEVLPCVQTTTKKCTIDQIRGVGTVVQAYDSDLTTFAGISPSANVQSILSAADYAAIRTLLTLVIGTNVQAYDADLTTYAGITPSANVQSILSAADHAAIRTLLGLVIGTNVQAYDADLTTYAGITPSANVQSILGAANYAAIKTLLTLTVGTDVQAYDADLTTYAGITPSANVQSVLSAADYSAIRTLLGLVIGTNVQGFDADLTTWAGVTPGTGVATFLATPNAANFAAMITGETGTGAPVLGTAPTIDAPIFTSYVRFPRVTAFPGTPAAGDTVIVTDDSAAGACDSAAGSTTSLCQYNGSAWVKLGDGTGGGGGDVSKVGTPVNNQVGVWTGDGTIEGSADLTWDGTTFTVNGNIASDNLADMPASTAQGDILYFTATNTLARLAKDATATRYLSNTGTTNNPAWAQINMANGVTGTLGAGNGGTGLTSLGTGVATWLGTPTIANLNAALSDADFLEAGTVTADNLCSATSTTVMGCTINTHAELVAIVTDLNSAAATLTNKTIAYGSNTITGLPVAHCVAISDETTAITTGTAKITFRMPYAMTLTAVRASLTTVSSSGTPTFDINEAGATILSTKLTIDASEKTSTTAATAAVISDTALADDAEMTIDIDTAGTGAAGAKICLIGTR